MINDSRFFNTIMALVTFTLLGIEQTSAAEPLEEISAELIDLLFNLGSEARSSAFYTTIPDSFPVIELPDNFEVRAAYEISDLTMVVLKSTLSPPEATESLVAAFIAAGGWSRYEYPRSDQQGFSVVPQFENTNLCHDSLPSVNIVAFERLLQAMNKTGGAETGLRDYLPVLKIPGEVLTGIGNSTGGSSGSRFVDSRFSANINWSLSKLNEHFARQLHEQGWELDSDWLGGKTAGGIWIFDKEVNPPIIGIMILMGKPNDSYDLYFRLMQ